MQRNNIYFQQRDPKKNMTKELEMKQLITINPFTEHKKDKEHIASIETAAEHLSYISLKQRILFAHSKKTVSERPSGSVTISIKREITIIHELIVKGTMEQSHRCARLRRIFVTRVFRTKHLAG